MTAILVSFRRIVRSLFPSFATAPFSQNFQNAIAKRQSLDLLYPLRLLVDDIEIKNEKLAHFLCQLIPCTCPFERDIKIFGHTFHIPPLCKLNPLYNEVVALRLRALTYLEGDCGEDITKYIC